MSVLDLPNQQYYLVLGSTWAASDFPSFSNSSPNKSHPGLHCFQTWEKAIELCKELAKQYKSYLFDYVKVGDILVSDRLRGHLQIQASSAFVCSDSMKRGERNYFAAFRLSCIEKKLSGAGGGGKNPTFLFVFLRFHPALPLLLPCLLHRLIFCMFSHYFSFFPLAQKMQAKFFDNIIKQVRPECEYFRVGFYGSGFPFSVRVSVNFLQTRGLSEVPFEQRRLPRSSCSPFVVV